MANGKMSSSTAWIAVAAVAVALSAPGAALGQSAASPDPTDAGKAVFKRANCFGCHKWHGNGGGGYGGDALSLRKTELTREQIINQLHQELPYATAVETETWEDRPDGSTMIRQQILVERDSQKAIVIGKGGRRLKSIGAAAREEIIRHLGRPVHLFLHVKVNPKWDEDRSLYRDIGLDWSE